MEKLDIVRTPVAMAKFVGEHLLGGGWSNLPAIATRETVVPQRLVRISENIILGEE